MNNNFGSKISSIKTIVKKKKWYFISVLTLVLTFSVFQNLIVTTISTQSQQTIADALAQMIAAQKKQAAVVINFF